MSTNNYVYDNICVVVHDFSEPDYFCEECGLESENKVCVCGSILSDRNEDYPFYDEDIEQWASDLSSEIKGFSASQRTEHATNGALIMGSIPIYKTNGEFYADIHATYRSGYYSGACLDYIVEYNNDWSDIDYVNNISKTLEKKIVSKCNLLARELRKFGIEIRKVGQFSNGEAVYEKVK